MSTSKITKRGISVGKLSRGQENNETFGLQHDARNKKQAFSSVLRAKTTFNPFAKETLEDVDGERCPSQAPHIGEPVCPPNSRRHSPKGLLRRWFRPLETLTSRRG